MELLTIKRTALGSLSTMGELYGPDGTFWCFTLEDPVRDIKIPDKTAIPSGTFEVVVSWSSSRKRLMPRLLNVPFFDGILIHSGNTVENTKGCILVGDDDPKAKTEDFLEFSRNAFDRIFPMIRKLAEKGELFIKIEGGFAPEDWKKEAPGAVS